MNPDTRRWWLLLAGALIGYALVMTANPARPSLRDGLRCLGRQRQLWLVPAGFGVAHAAFGWSVRFTEAWIVPGASPVLLPWTGWQLPVWSVVWAGSLLPAAEATASIFNCIVTTFPLSALWGALLLGNWRGYQSVLYRGLRRRCGRPLSLAIHIFLLVCALAAVSKPLMFGGWPRLNTLYGEGTLLRLGEAVNALSFFFEYLLGVAVQVYLVALVFAWVRGLNFDFDGLCRFALRRFTFVFKWAAVILGVSTLGINLPLVLASFRSPDAPWEPGGVIRATRWALTAILLVLCSLQILLVFHNESLRRAVGDAAQLWVRYGWHLAWLIVVAALHFLALALADAFLPPALGQRTWPAAAWNLLLYPLLWSGLAGWFLASWVCLFRRCERNRPDGVDLVRF